MKQIYLDNAATTKVDDKVARLMNIYFKENYANASSQHSFGQISKESVEKSRRIIAEAINAKPKEIIFTSGGTESNNMAIKGLFLANNKKHIITTKIEHDSILNVCKYLESNGARITYLNVDREGLIDLDELRNAITNETLVVSIIQGNNEIGTLQDLDKIGKICNDRGTLLHVDACQSFTKSNINVKEQNISLLTINGHKIHGPKGVGALYIKEGIKLIPLLHGGGHENGFRCGTENVPGIVGFGEAVRISRAKEIEKIADLRDYTIGEIMKIPKTSLNGARSKSRLCNNINVSFTNIEGEAVRSHLEVYGIMISTGSACASHTLKKSHVLRAIGLNDLEINSSIRISLSKFTKKREIDYFIKKLNMVVDRLRKISPFDI